MTTCKCGCGSEIIPRAHHSYRGTPEYLRGHGPKVKGRAPRKGWTIINGYKAIWIRSRVKSRGEKGSSYRFEHRMVMEQILGRPLLRNEFVHHRDHNRLNNDPANLELTDHDAHARIHAMPGVDQRHHVHKHIDCECGKSTGLTAEWREKNRAQRSRDFRHGPDGKFVAK